MAKMGQAEKSTNAAVAKKRCSAEFEVWVGTAK
jgi:hypothetical protein